MKNIPLDLKAPDKQGLMANYHTHTKRCMHAGGEDREYVEAAIKAGFKILGFSDHAPQFFKDDYVSRMRMLPSQVEEYVDSITGLAKEYKNDITILLGLETEYFPDKFDDLIRFIEPYPFDYMIMGQHWIYNEHKSTVVTNPAMTESFLEDYVNQVLEGMRTGYFTYIAHPDIIKFPGDVAVYKKHMRRLVLELKALNIPMEINALGYKAERHYPNRIFLEEIKDIGADFVIGVDAHSPEALLDVKVRKDCLKLAGEYGLNVINTIV